MLIRAAAPDEGARLREIAVAAKAHWGYERTWVEAWADGAQFEGKELFVAEIGGSAVGWASLIPRGEVAWLDDLWIEPEAMGQGIGSSLFEHAAQRGRELGAVRLEWEAEPNATGFYERMGGRRLRGEIMAVDL